MPKTNCNNACIMCIIAIANNTIAVYNDYKRHINKNFTNLKIFSFDKKVLCIFLNTSFIIANEYYLLFCTIMF